MKSSVYIAALLPFRLISACVSILTSRRLLLPCLVPVLIGLLAFTLFFGLAIGFRAEAAAMLVTFEQAWLQALTAWLVLSFNVVLSALLALLVMSALGSVFIESFIEEVFKRHHIELPKHPTVSSLIRGIWRGVRDDLRLIIYIGFCALLVLAAGLVPILFFLPPLFAAFLSGYNLFDLPLALLEIPFKERRRIAAAHWIEVVSLGAVFLLILVIPLGAVLFLPAAYYVAVERLAAWKVGARAVDR